MFKIQRMSMRQLLVLSFTFQLTLLLGVALYAVWGLSGAQHRLQTMVNDELQRAMLGRDVRAAASARAIAARNLVLVQDRAQQEEEHNAVLAAHARVGKSLDKLREAVQGATISAEEREQVKTMALVEEQYGRVALAIVDLALKGQQEAAIHKMNAECRPLLKELIQATSAYTAYITAASNEEMRLTTDSIERQRIRGHAGIRPVFCHKR